MWSKSYPLRCRVRRYSFLLISSSNGRGSLGKQGCDIRTVYERRSDLCDMGDIYDNIGNPPHTTLPRKRKPASVCYVIPFLRVRHLGRHAEQGYADILTHWISIGSRIKKMDERLESIGLPIRWLEELRATSHPHCHPYLSLFISVGSRHTGSRDRR